MLIILFTISFSLIEYFHASAYIIAYPKSLSHDACKGVAIEIKFQYKNISPTKIFSSRFHFSINFNVFVHNLLNLC